MASAQVLIKKFSNLKTLPHVAIRLSKLLASEETPLKEFESIIRMDPTLVLRLLRIANSSYYGIRQKVDTISRVIVIIGTNTLRNMVVVSALKDIFAKSSNEELFSISKLWLHCSAVAVCSQMISERIFGKNGEDAFLCGILHDIGLIVEYQVVEDLFIQTCNELKSESGSKSIIEYERNVIGTDHCKIGSLIGQDWKLPIDVQDGIKYHHLSQEDVIPESISGIVQIAEYAATKLRYPALKGIRPELSNNIREYLGKNMNEFKSVIKALPEEMSKAKEIFESEEN